MLSKIIEKFNNYQTRQNYINFNMIFLPKSSIKKIRAC